LIAYRLSRRAYVALDGEGARLYGGRWNPKGVPMVYAASTLSLAALECLVHFAPSTLPTSYVSVAIEIPDDVPTEEWTVVKLPKNWAETPAPASLQALGARWVREARTAVLLVPSAVIPGERNVLLNPRHPDAERIHGGKPLAFGFDSRLRK
jgi:RES domain-containing protein